MLRNIMSLSKMSKLSNLHPLEKLILVIIPIVLNGFTMKPLIIIINIICFIVLHILCRHSLKIVASFVLASAGFALLSTVTFVFDYGINFCLIILLKAFSGGICIAFLALTTPIEDILFIIAKVPGLRDVCDIAKSMVRFLILIEDESVILYNSIKSRGGFDSFSLKLRNTGKLAGLLFVNTLKRWNSIKDGINSRCYNGCMPCLTNKFVISKKRIILVTGYNFLLVILIVVKIHW